MLACLDAAYHADRAAAACVLSAHWDDAAPAATRVARVAQPPAPYVPGELWRRELPALLAVLASAPPLDAVVIDAFVWLAGPDRPGLGGHLFHALGGKVPVVGVAKTAFRGAWTAVPVLRGRSRRPLYVNAVGMDPDEAARLVASMHGRHRIPTLLAAADRLARAAVRTPLPRTS